jgi:hypothetical protein
LARRFRTTRARAAPVLATSRSEVHAHDRRRDEDVWPGQQHRTKERDKMT